MNEERVKGHQHSGTRVPLRLLAMETEGIPADGPTPATPAGPVIYRYTVDLPPMGDNHRGNRGDDDDDRREVARRVRRSRPLREYVTRTQRCPILAVPR